MPRGDGTGPMGNGSMRGRAAGYCGGYQTPGYMNPVLGRGFGRGLDIRRGAGIGGISPVIAPFGAPAAQDEQQYLKEQSQMLQNQLENIQKRIDELADQQAKQG